MRKIFKSKKGILALIGTSSLITSAALISILVVTVDSSTDFSHYVFDGRTFNTKEELNEYINSNISYNSKETAHDFYLYDSKPYAIDSLYEITKDLESKHKIEEHKTYKNINNQIIDSANQLSDNVITNKNENLIDVYQGRDGMAYTNKKEAVETFQDIEKQYIINNLIGDENVEFANQSDAIAYYENIVRKQIESGEMTDKYNVSGLDMTKDQVLQWIAQTSDIRYEHNGFYWSPNNVTTNTSELKLTKKDEEKIQPFKPVKNAYWLNYDSNGLSGAFSGPQYIESDLSESQFQTQLYTGWYRADTKSMNALLAPLMGISSLIKAAANLTEKNNIKEWSLEDLFVNKSNENIKNLNILFKKVTNELSIQDSSSFEYQKIKTNLSSIDGLPVFEKNLVFMKNLYYFIITRNNNGKEQDILNLINFLKQTLKELIQSTTSIVDEEFLDSLLIKETLGTSRSERVLNFADILDLFLNPSKFQYTSPGKLEGMDNLIKGLNDIGDIVFGDFSKINALKKDINKNREEIMKLNMDNALYQFNNIKFSSDSERKKYEQEMMKEYSLAKIDNDTGEVKFKKDKGNGEIKPMSAVDKMLSGFNVAKAVWDIGNIVSFLTYKTYENDLGNGQVLRYQVIGFKIPLLNIDIPNETFKENITQKNLIDGSFFPDPVISGNPENDGYFIVYGSLFTGKAAAIDYLKHYIISNPLKFSDTNMLYINVMSQQEEFEIKINKDSDNQNEFEYQFLTQFEEFKLKIFDKYFAAKAVKTYGDGFGNFFQNKADALNSMSQNITNKKFVVKYKIIEAGISYYYDSLEQAWNQQKIFIENKLISKTILNSDLIKTTFYNELEEYSGIEYSIFKVYFGGKNRYFATYNDALYYIFNNTDIKRKQDTSVYFEISFKGRLFKSEAVFYQWISDNTKEVKGQVN